MIPGLRVEAEIDDVEARTGPFYLDIVVHDGQAHVLAASLGLEVSLVVHAEDGAEAHVPFNLDLSIINLSYDESGFMSFD